MFGEYFLAFMVLASKYRLEVSSKTANAVMNSRSTSFGVPSILLAALGGDDDRPHQAGVHISGLDKMGVVGPQDR